MTRVPFGSPTENISSDGCRVVFKEAARVRGSVVADLVSCGCDAWRYLRRTRMGEGLLG